MNHDFSQDPISADATAFKEWLLSETVSALKAAQHGPENQKAAIDFFAAKACEARMPDRDLAQIFGTALVGSHLTDTEEDIAYDWLEDAIDSARQTYPL